MIGLIDAVQKDTKMERAFAEPTAVDFAVDFHQNYGGLAPEESRELVEQLIDEYMFGENVTKFLSDPENVKLLDKAGSTIQ
jgi:hypothetical protein